MGSELLKKAMTEHVNDLIKGGDVDPNLLNDGYHTFKELYDFRMIYNAVLFNEWAIQVHKVKFTSARGYTEETLSVACDVHKSRRHHDGELCFGGGWFIVVAILATGQISNHYPDEYWGLFKIPEEEKAKYPFDGHTSQDVFERLKSLCI